MKKVYLTIILFLNLTNTFAAADTTSHQSPFKFSGFVDTYYFANSNKVLSNLGASGIERVFDQRANSFEVGMAQMKMMYNTTKVEGVIDLTFGNHADLSNYNNYISPLGTKITSTSLAIKQAYMSYKMNDKWTITGGQFITHVGYEVIDAPLNYNYSLSNLFGNGPYYHTGIKAIYVPNAKVSYMAGVVDGLDVKDDKNKGKALIGQFMFKPVDTWAVYLNYFKSNEGTDLVKSIYHLYDLTSTYQITEKLYLGLNSAYGTQSGKKWYGTAVYSNYVLGPKFSLGARYEYFNNKSGIRALKDAQGNGTSVKSLTITGNIKLADNLLLKPEIRNDSYLANSNQFVNSQGKYVNAQTTFGAAAIFYFN